ncbi:uncharacterized protein PFL1_06004 [Pseudozyma flocculosa PF-1]|uniref:Sensitive to high expression protein 9, mitochondrial n=2 Tax=Pseudozyma flocculosa TaxID=84751 RepID=A0A5C3F547_9BASI|nr:uncharacterized protein PFL1_06004 [Pseudozyma flocculosa PF-1]EPQ26356.1 hypothetical protein PFL1_06004 [Pseudozyma flocculosa PF-1]SPO39055.1 uncharacterized protein PSFLO_04534 [Pseudozyma flocculosa]
MSTGDSDKKQVTSEEQKGQQQQQLQQEPDQAQPSSPPTPPQPGPNTSDDHTGSSTATTDSPSPPSDHHASSFASGSHTPSQISANLASLLTTARSTAQQRISTLQPRINRKISDLNQRWNAYTGFESINALKSAVSDLETSLAASRRDLAEAKARYLSAVSTRSASQRATNDLLSRRASWSEQDLSEYTRLLRSEHQQAKEEEMAEKNLDEREREVQNRFDDLMKGVMTRYHEEQIWSDRVRSVSTYGSIAVVALNALLFILAILIVEPYKRKRLAQTFETRLLQGEEQGRQMVQQTIHAFDAKVEKLVDQLAIAIKGDDLTRVDTAPAPSPASPTTVSAPPAMVEEDEEGRDAAWRMEQMETIERDVDDFVSTQLEDSSAAVGAMTSIAEAATKQRQDQERKRQAELVVASTAGVVAGALLSIVLGACWTG